MNRNIILSLFTIFFLIAVPASVHSSYQGVYTGAKGGENGIGPICTTIPYLFLVILFLANCFDLKSKSRRTAYCGAVMAWLAMMSVTLSIISHPPSPNLSPDGMIVALTPLAYIPFLVIPYIVGVITGRIWTKWKDKKVNGEA